MFKFFHPDNGDSPKEQYNSCCRKIKTWLGAEELDPERIIALNVFARILSDTEYERTEYILHSLLRTTLPGIHSMNILAQQPGNGNHVTLAIHILPPGISSFNLQKKTLNGIHYTVLTGKNGDKILFVPGIRQDFPENFIFSASEKVFLEMEKILRSEKMNFSNIVRQWNYIEDITTLVDTASGKKQHYQVFNDVRARYYDKYDFDNGYPAATGIGTYAGGIVVGFYAAMGKNFLIKSIDNPLQSAPHEYSDTVLIGKETFRGSKKSPPRFARAKFVRSPLGNLIFISGTASVRGEKTMGSTAAEQAGFTLQNISHLISPDNLSKSGVPAGSETPLMKYLRISVKHRKYLKDVSKICNEFFPDVPTLYLISDICRDDLLVEIEGAAKILTSA